MHEVSTPGQERGAEPSLRRPLVLGTLLASLVALPALVARPWADERFVLYWPEQLAGARPWLLVNQVIDEIPAYLDTGVFRPLSRLAFYLEHWLVVRISIATGFPPNVVAGVVKVAVMAALLAVTLTTLDQYRRAVGGNRRDDAWRRVVWVTTAAFAASLVLFNPATHPLTLFPLLYLGTTAFALAVPVGLGRIRLAERRGPPARGQRFLLFSAGVVVGAAAASMIELAYLALPLGLVHLLGLTLAGGARWRPGLRELLRSVAFRVWAAVAAGFLAVFVPTRIAIIDFCAELDCYRAAEPALGLEFLTTLPLRLGSAFFPVPVLAQQHLLRRAPGSAPELVLIAVVVGAVAGLVLWRALPASPYGGRPVGAASVRGAAGPLLGYFATALVLGAILSALSASVQDRGFDLSPWRETGFAWVAWSGIIGVVAALLLARRTPSRRGHLLVVATLAFALVPSSIVNQMDMERVRAQPEGRLHTEAALLIVSFDRTADGNEQRCRVVDGLRAIAPTDSELRKMNLVAEFLDATAQNHYREPFCDRTEQP